MATVDVKQFEQTILKSKLLDRDLLKAEISNFEESKKTEPATAKDIALFLISRGHLTRYQAKRLLAGHFAGFFLGGCRILDRIGEGGMGVVYLAEHVNLKRRVALKVLPFQGTTDNDAVKRFYREARSAAKLKHQNIVQVFDVNQEGDTHFIVMEYVDGRNIYDIIKKQGPFSVEKSLSLVRQIAEGLQHAHQHGVIHRDIKPANLVMDGNNIKILDLGLARQKSDDQITGDHSVLGTLDYMSPEQCEDSSKVDQRSDLYSLGCTWYHMLAGAAPFADRHATAKMLGHISGQLPCVSDSNPDISPAIVSLISRLTARKKEDRFQDAAAFLQSLATVCGNIDDGTVISASAIKLSPGGSSATTPMPNTPTAPPPRVDSDLELSERHADHRTAVHTPREHSTISLAFLIPVMAALVLGGIYIGIQLLADRLPGVETIVIDVPSQPKVTGSPAEGDATPPSGRSELSAGVESDQKGELSGVSPEEGPPGLPETVTAPTEAASIQDVSKQAKDATASLAGPEAMADLPAQDTNKTSTSGAGTHSGMPQVEETIRAARETVVRDFQSGWQDELVSGDTLTLVSPDVYELSSPVQISKTLTIQGTESQRGLLRITVGAESSFWEQVSSSLTLRHLDIYIEAGAKPPGALDIFKLNNSDIYLSDCSVSIVAPPAATWDEISLIQMNGSRPWDREASGDPPEPLIAMVDDLFVRGLGTIVRTTSTQARLSFADSLIVGTGPLVHAFNTEARQFAHQILDVRVTSSTIDIQQPLLTVDCRPFDLRPVPMAVHLQSSAIATLSSVAAAAPLCFWSSPTTSSAIADTLSFVGTGNVYIRRENGLMGKFSDGDVRTLVQTPADWSRQHLGEDSGSFYMKDLLGIVPGQWEQRTPKGYDLTSPMRKNSSQKDFEKMPGVSVRGIKSPRRLSMKDEKQ